MYCTGTKATGCPCFNCAQVTSNAHPDLTVVIPPDGKDIGIETSRGILEATRSYPSMAPARIVIIDGIDRITVPAANALLKMLEEPPPTVRFLLLAESGARVLPTIRSRSGQVAFRPLPEAYVLSTLQRFEKSTEKALVYARLSEGSVGRAIQLWGAGRLLLRDKVVSLLSLSLKGDVAGCFSLVDQLEKDLPLALHFLGLTLHDLLMLPYDPTKIINVDRLTELEALRVRVPAAVWQRLRQSVQEVQALYRGTRIQLGFHTKALLLESFQGA